jgi:hypothetical protein
MDVHSEDESEDEAINEQDNLPSTAKDWPRAFDDFLGFLQLGCNGTPTTGYPIVVLIVDTLPPEARTRFSINILCLIIPSCSNLTVCLGHFIPLYLHGHYRALGMQGKGQETHGYERS